MVQATGMWGGLAFAISVCFGASATAQQTPIEVGREVESKFGAVACVDHYAAAVGARVLADGGNAVDAAVAVGFALAVTHPAAGNLGGGGFMVVTLADGRRATIDYREVAPTAASPTMFLDEHGEIDARKAGIGHWVVGVPGTVAGLEAAHRNFGSLPWARLVAPSVALARDGIVVDDDLARGLAAYAPVFQRFPETARCFLKPDGQPYVVGDTWRQPDLANTLRWIRDDGAKAFYHGPIADLLAAEMHRARALITADDLANYRPLVRVPLEWSYRDHDVVSMPLPSSGGVATAQILGLLEPLGLREMDPDSASARHWIAEAQRRAFADRATWLGDPEATHIDVASLLTGEHLDELRRTMQAEQASRSEEFGPPITVPEGRETTHFGVVDVHGNAVANTYTLEESYGSKVVARGLGFLLNNELHDFNLKPGLTDRRGRIGTEPNLARAGHRPLSSMTPTIVLDGTRPSLVTGSPGGRTIINTVTCVLLAVLEWEMPLEEAVAWTRQHHQWYPDELRLEQRGVDESVDATLGSWGHSVRRVSRQGDAHTLSMRADGTVHAVADRRIDGWVAAPLWAPR